MSKLNQIQTALLQIDATKFQKLCDCYFKSEGYSDIDPVGAVTGMDKPRKGTPDSILYNSDKKPVFVEYTTQQSGTLQKFIGTTKKIGDIEKCLDESKTGIPVAELAEIILCYTERLPPKDKETLKKVGLESGVTIRLLPLDTLSHDLYEHYPRLIKDFLGIEIDTGQILSCNDFVSAYGRHHLSTPLDTPFSGREEEIEKARSVLEEGNLLLLSGSAGVGKSRLALEILDKFQTANSSYQTYCIYNKARDVYDDLKSYFSRAGNFLIFVDDANRSSNFDYVIDLLLHQRNDQNIKIIATVRDYALGMVENKAKAIQSCELISIEPLTEDQINKLLEDSFNIRNHEWLTRINDLAKGNPRLAIMAGRTAMNGRGLADINDVSALYDEYFSSIIQDLADLNDKSLLRIAGIISFFRSLDKSNEAQGKLVFNLFKIEPSVFWQGVEKLHQLEIVDLYENEAVKMSDQVLATYLFYAHFFKNSPEELNILLGNLLVSHRQLIVDSIYPCVNTFSSNETLDILKPFVNEVWKSDDPEILYILASTFYFVNPDKTLLYIKNEIDVLPNSDFAPEDLFKEKEKDYFESSDEKSIINLLRKFSNSWGSELETAIDLACLYALKAPQEITKTVELLAKEIGFSINAFNYGYEREKHVVARIIDNAKGDKTGLLRAVFPKIACYYLQTNFEEHRSRGNSITFTRFKLVPHENIYIIRNSIWDFLFELFEDQQAHQYVLQTLEDYVKPEIDGCVSEIAQKDSEKIIPFFEEKLSPDDFRSCKLVHDFQQHKATICKQDISGLTAKFSCQDFKVYQLLDFHAYREERVDWRAEEQRRQETIEINTMDFSVVECIDFFKSYKNISETLTDSHPCVAGFDEFLKVLLIRDWDIVEKVILGCLKVDAQLLTQHRNLIISNLFKSHDRHVIQSLLERVDPAQLAAWQFIYFVFLPDECGEVGDIKTIIHLYENASHYDMPYMFDYLKKFEIFEPKILPKVITIIVDLSEKELDTHLDLSRVFYAIGDWDCDIKQLFEGYEDVLKRAYITSLFSKNHFDYDGAFLNQMLDVEDTFLIDLVRALIEAEDRHSNQQNFSSLWERADFPNLFEEVMEQVVETLSDQEYFYRREYALKGFFGIGHDEVKGSQTVFDAQDIFLCQYIGKYAHDADKMHIAFDIIINLQSERKLKFFQEFLHNNKNFEDFKKIRLLPNHWSSVGGSMVPTLVRRKELYEKVRELCTGADFIEHREYLSENIDSKNAYIERTKKSEFMEDRY